MRLRIKEIRRLKRLTQEQLGVKIGVKQNHIYKIEAGLRNPPLKTLQKIADALAVSITDLIDETKDEPALSTSDKS